jgi:hypothetical protein
MVGVRGFLYRTGITISLGAVAVGAVDTSMLNDDFNSVRIDVLADQRVDAYIKIVDKTKKVTDRRFVAAKHIRIVAEDWIQGANMGKLLPIMPGYFGENITDGPKGEIVRSCIRLARRLSDLADQEYDSGDYLRSSEDAIRALDLLNIVRFSTPAVYDMTLAFYRKPLQIVNMALAHRPKLGSHMYARLTKKNRLEEKFKAMKSHDHNIRTQYAVRYGEHMLRQDEMQTQMFTAKEVHSASPFAEVPGEKKARVQAQACGFVAGSY